MATRTRIAVIGVGNEFRRDDGVGRALIARLRTRSADRPLPPGPVLATSDGDPARLIGLWEGADLAVVVDAAHAHPAHPGLVHRLELGSGRLAHPATTSSHGLGLGEAVELARVLDRLPGRLVVYAVESADTTVGTELSAPIRAVLTPLARSVEDEILRHRTAAAGGGRD
ncbi:hydrogenase maturation protease [Streptomyces melanogenes]|uniref:hydrogenase maturation protease n=1 Tax=Streptomyces melanogenes TaxID=67326 RepID=UPI00167D053E|nr:hydrogenase maturation protease [Streptomyces melanogenes]GGP94231.1 peptidase M52 [Streptomyces melanogenes]